MQAIAEKIDALIQQMAEATNVVSSNQSKVWILVVDAQLSDKFLSKCDRRSLCHISFVLMLMAKIRANAETMEVILKRHNKL